MLCQLISIKEIEKPFMRQEALRRAVPVSFTKFLADPFISTFEGLRSFVEPI